MPTIEDYLKNLTPSQHAEYERIRSIVKEMVPDVEEVLSYGIPTFKREGKYLIYFAAYPTHMSVYPVMKETLVELEGRLGDFKLTKETLKSKGTVQFSEDNPVPESLVKEIVKRSLKQYR